MCYILHIEFEGASILQSTNLSTALNLEQNYLWGYVPLRELPYIPVSVVYPDAAVSVSV